MSGRGKGGKGLGKGAAKRHRRTTPKQFELGKPAIKRLARKGGAKRVAKDCYPLVCTRSYIFLERLIRCAIEYCLVAKRKTLTVNDCMNGVKKMGVKMMGY